MGQRLTRSSPSPRRAQPSLAAPLPPCPEGASLQLLPPGKASLCLHIPSAWAQLLPALTWEATNPWDSNPGNTCQRDTINPCPPHSLAPPARSTPSQCPACWGGPGTHAGSPQHPPPSTQRGFSPCTTHAGENCPQRVQGRGYRWHLAPMGDSTPLPTPGPSGHGGHSRDMKRGQHPDGHRRRVPGDSPRWPWGRGTYRIWEV